MQIEKEKRKMKKLIALILALLLATALFACTKQNKKEDEQLDFDPTIEEDDGKWSIVV